VVKQRVALYLHSGLSSVTFTFTFAPAHNADIRVRYNQLRTNRIILTVIRKITFTFTVKPYDTVKVNNAAVQCVY
jgi:hypothetical protein